MELIISEATVNPHCQENNTIRGKFIEEKHYSATLLGSGQFLKEKIDAQLKVDLNQAALIL